MFNYLENSRTLIDFGIESDICSENNSFKPNSELIKFTSADSEASYFAASEFDTSTKKDMISTEIFENDLFIQNEYILNDDWFPEDKSITVFIILYNIFKIFIIQEKETNLLVNFADQNDLNKIYNTHSSHHAFNISKNIEFNNNYKEKTISLSPLIIESFAADDSTDNLIILSPNESTDNQSRKRLFINVPEDFNSKNENICNEQNMKKFCYYK